MIRNIVFDMGQVLNRFDPEMFLDRAGIFGEDRDLLRREVFQSLEWSRLDRGSLTDDEAIAFLNFMATSEEGHDYMVNKAAMVPAFTNVTLEPATPLSKSVMQWNAAGKTYSWQQYKLPDGFGMGTLGAIYELLASGAIDEPTFEQMMKDAIATIPSL